MCCIPLFPRALTISSSVIKYYRAGVLWNVFVLNLVLSISHQTILASTKWQRAKVDTGSILLDDFPRYYPILIISDVGFTDIAGFFNDLAVKTGNPVTRQGITLYYSFNVGPYLHPSYAHPLGSAVKWSATYGLSYESRIQ